MRKYNAADVDEYIASAEPVAQPTLRELRKVVLATVPDAEERISWGVPFYRYHGLLGGYSVFTNHVSFGLAFALSAEIREALEKKGYKTGSKTVQIKFDQKVPVGDIKKLLLQKAKQNQADQP